MAIPTNTYQTYAQVGIKEDVADLIFDISPTETPFVTKARKTKATNTVHEWQTDALADAAANANIEGDTTTAVAAVATKRLKNFTQILKKVVSVSGTARAVKTYGRADEFEYQLAKRMKELKRDLELAAVGNQAGTAGAAASAPTMASVESWIATNAQSVQEGTAGTTHGATTGTFPTRAPVDSTSAGSLTEAALKNAINLAWNAGGDPKVLMCSGKVKQKISGGFTGVATRFRNVNAGAQAEIISGVDLYVSDFGEHQLIPNRFMRTSVLLVLDMDYWAVASLRNFTMERLAKNGDADVAHIVGEYTIESRNEKASAKVADIDPAK